MRTSDPQATLTTTLPRARPAARWSIAAAASTSGQVRSTTGTTPPSSASATSRARSGGLLAAHEEPQPLPQQRRERGRAELALDAAEPRAAGLPADDDQRAPGGQHPAQPAHRAGPADVDHHVVRRLRAVLEGEVGSRPVGDDQLGAESAHEVDLGRAAHRVDPGTGVPGELDGEAARRHRRRRSPGPARRGGPRRRRAPPAWRSAPDSGAAAASSKVQPRGLADQPVDWRRRRARRTSPWEEVPITSSPTASSVTPSPTAATTPASVAAQHRLLGPAHAEGRGASAAARRASGARRRGRRRPPAPRPAPRRVPAPGRAGPPVAHLLGAAVLGPARSPS